MKDLSMDLYHFNIIFLYSITFINIFLNNKIMYTRDTHIILSFIIDIFVRKTLLSIENENPDVAEIERIPIYNYVSVCQNPITWRRFMKLNETYGMQVPSSQILWYYMFFLNKHKLVDNICNIFMHIIPAIIADSVLFLSGRKPM